MGNRICDGVFGASDPKKIFRLLHSVRLDDKQTQKSTSAHHSLHALKCMRARTRCRPCNVYSCIENAGTRNASARASCNEVCAIDVVCKQSLSPAVYGCLDVRATTCCDENNAVARFNIAVLGKAMVLSYEDAPLSDTMPYLVHRLTPLPVTAFVGRAAKRNPPVPVREAVWWWFKDRASTVWWCAVPCRAMQ